MTNSFSYYDENKFYFYYLICMNNDEINLLAIDDSNIFT